MEKNRRQNAPRKTPRFTKNPPQLHHDLPSKNTPEFVKPPAKLPFDLSKIFSSVPIEKLRETVAIHDY
jgi:hypothetical protein